MKQKKIINKKYFELSGCLHNHTQYSFDSEVNVSHIIEEAKKSGLDYITINDHLTYEARQDKAVLNEKDLIVIVGIEINDENNNNHFLVFNSDKIIRNGKADQYVKEYMENGAIGFAAHPMERRSCDQFRKYIWTDLKNDSFDGLEIWNFLSSWLEKMIPKLNGIFLILFPSLFVKKPYKELLKYWDDLNNAGKRKAAVGGIDAHQENYSLFGIKIKFLTHRALFKTLRMNILLPETERIDQFSILKALKNGNSYLVNYKIGVPYNFYAVVAADDEEGIIFGEEISFRERLKLYFQLSQLAKVKLIRNGKKISQKFGDRGFFNIPSAGNFRLEITRFGRGWIYTNNFYVV